MFVLPASGACSLAGTLGGLGLYGHWRAQEEKQEEEIILVFPIPVYSSLTRTPPSPPPFLASRYLHTWLISAPFLLGYLAKARILSGN